MANKSIRKAIKKLLETAKTRNPIVRVMKMRNQKAGVHASNSKRARANKYACRGKVDNG